MKNIDHHRPILFIPYMAIVTFAISLYHVAIKALSGGYPLHQLALIRSVLGLAITVVILPFEDGFAALRVRKPGLDMSASR